VRDLKKEFMTFDLDKMILTVDPYILNNPESAIGLHVI